MAMTPLNRFFPLLFGRGERAGEESNWINTFSSIGISRRRKQNPSP
jgi:hypothetical protein